jgi:polyphosphate kinase
MMTETPGEPTVRQIITQAPDLTLDTYLKALGHLAQTIDSAFQTQGCLPHTPIAFDPTLGLTTPAAAETEATLEASAIIGALGQLICDLIPTRLEQKGIFIWPVKQLNAQQQNWLTNYFTHHIYPVLTPLAVDPGRPFPYLSSDSLNLLIVLQPPAEQRIIGGPLYARVKVPRQVVPRLVHIPAIGIPAAHIQPAAHLLVWSEEIIRYFADQLFPGMAVTAIYQFRLLRAHITSDPTHLNLRPKQQKMAPVVRLDVEEGTPPRVLRWLLEHLNVPSDVVVYCAKPLTIASLTDLANSVAALSRRPSGPEMQLPTG